MFNNKYTTIFLYAITFLVLASVSIWDVVNIITEYNFGNRVTSVKQINMGENDAIPFLGKMRICLNYPSRRVFLNKAVSDLADFYSLANNSWNGRELSWAKNMSDEEQRFGKSMLDIHMFKLIGYIDSNGLDFNFYNTANLTNVSYDKFVITVDNFIESPNSIDKMKNAWSEVRQIFIAQGDNGYNGYMSSSVPAAYDIFGLNKDNNFLPSMECFSISLTKKLASFNLDLITAATSIWFSDLETASVKIDLPGSQFIFPTDKTPKPAPLSLSTININVFSIALLNGEQFLGCTKDFETEDECLFDLKLRTIGEICKCQPFSLTLTKACFSNKSQIDIDTPLCTPTMYKQCWERANAEATSRQEAKKSRSKLQTMHCSKKFL